MEQKTSASFRDREVSRCCFVSQFPGGRGFAIQHSALFLSLVTWPGSWVEREAACSGLSVTGPASQLLKLASADTVLWVLGGEATGVPLTPAMEEQDHACDPTWEPPQAKSSPDSPWSWVRARAWPHANRPTPLRCLGPLGLVEDRCVHIFPKK